MRLRDFSFLLILLTTANIFGQYKISGEMTSATGEAISNVEIYNSTTGERMFSASSNFEIEFSDAGSYQLAFYKDNYALVEIALTAPADNVTIVFDKINSLSEVVIKQQRDKIFSLNKLRDIEETAIYAGKKTEVIAVGKLTANKSANNARQIFGQVVGLTINEGADGGLQLNIGGRGLNPNRTSNFNTRQNDYDISADVLGYPESYYATATEALEEIQVVRGAASLQYGTQFGGLVNFKIKSPSKKAFEAVIRNTIGSYGLYTNFTSLSGTNGKFSYYTFFNYKEGNGARPNSNFVSRNYFANLNYQFSVQTSLHFDYTYFDYLAKQPGGLTDFMFQENPDQSNRTRNWFDVNWNLFALRLKHQFADESNFSLQLFGLNASRKTVGYRSNRVSSSDVLGTERDLILGDFVNWGVEARYLKSYKINENKSAFLIGAKYYQSKNTAFQGAGSSGSDANFNPATAEYPLFQNQSDYRYPNLNVAVFGENIFRISSKFSVTPGFRLEKIRTQAIGSYREINRDLAGNVIFDDTISDNIVKERNLILFGIGVSYKPKNRIELYGNISQNYRSVTFTDIRTVVPNLEIAADIKDEKGFTSDVGIRGQIGDKVSFDASIYGLLYDDKIGEYDGQNLKKIRDNVGTAITYGFETMVDWNLNKTFFKESVDFDWNVFSNIAITASEYLESDIANVSGNDVEFVPLVNIKTGTGIGYKNFLASLQFTYLSSQFTDATNSTVDANDNTGGIFGEIPSYYVADFSASYKWKKWKVEAGVNNFTNNSYFTRRATGYPGPGIIPSDKITFYTTLEFTF